MVCSVPYLSHFVHIYGASAKHHVVAIPWWAGERIPSISEISLPEAEDVQYVELWYCEEGNRPEPHWMIHVDT